MFRIIIILILLLLATLYNPFRGPEKRIFVYPDESFSAVIDSLNGKGVLVSKPWISFLARLTGCERKIKPGYYWIGKTEAPLLILNELKKGGIDTIKITIPEGFDLRQIGLRLAQSGLVDIDTFNLLVHDKEFIKSLGIDYTTSLEGFLFPDTYIFSIFASEKRIISRMVRRFRKIIRDLGIGDSVYERLILASIVEREAKVDSERPIIAAIFLKRLATGRPLESCATVDYALGDHHSHLKYSDLKAPSPYNTYLNFGLPPTPICSPGRSSLKAVINPISTGYLYFVSNGHGGHRFSKTFHEHLLAKRRQNWGK